MRKGWGCVEANGSLHWVRLFVYSFLLSLPGLGLTAGDFKAGVLVWGSCVCFHLHLFLRTTDWIIATRLHFYSLGDSALVLFCSALVAFLFVCSFVSFWFGFVS